jgi:hypothetical protein
MRAWFVALAATIWVIVSGAGVLLFGGSGYCIFARDPSSFHGRNHCIFRRHNTGGGRSPSSDFDRLCGSQPVLAEQTRGRTSLVSVDDRRVSLCFAVYLSIVGRGTIHNLACSLAGYWRDTGHATHCKSSNSTVPEDMSISSRNCEFR